MTSINRGVAAVLAILLVGVLLAACLPTAPAVQLRSMVQSATGQPREQTAQESYPSALRQSQATDPESVVAVYERVSPAVVNIDVTARAIDPLGRAVPRDGAGSGFIIDREGHIVTNQHVVANAQRLDVTLADGTTHIGQVLAVDPATDLAIIKLQAPAEKLSQLTVAPLGDSGELKVGQTVVAIGNPFGLERSATLGIVSSLGRIRPGLARLITDMIQTDAAINPGNSGGPLLNLKGEVIGINQQIQSSTQGSVGVGFAIPVNTLKRNLNEMLAGRVPPHTWIGVAGTPLTPGLAEQLGLQLAHGLLVTAVPPNGPAAAAGLRAAGSLNPAAGDVITHIDDVEVRRIEDLAAYIDGKRPNDTVRLTYVRGGQTHTVEVTLGVWQATEAPGR